MGRVGYDHTYPVLYIKEHISKISKALLGVYDDIKPDPVIDPS